MAYPNNECGECSAWLSADTNNDKDKIIHTDCQYCPLFSTQQFVRHIPSQCCYPLEADGKTVIICGAHLTPKIDGKIFWEYVDRYIEKIAQPSDPFRRD